MREPEYIAGDDHRRDQQRDQQAARRAASGLKQAYAQLETALRSQAERSTGT